MKIIVAVLAIVLLVGAHPSETIREYELKAEFLERFTRFIDWPHPPRDSTPFVIGVLGRDPFGTHLRSLAASRRIKNRKVTIRYLKDPSEIGVDCQVLFIARTDKENLSRILDRTESRPILTVSDTEGFASRGVLINFYSADDKIRFEINAPALEKSGLKASSNLLRLARLVEPEEKRR